MTGMDDIHSESINSAASTQKKPLSHQNLSDSFISERSSTNCLRDRVSKNPRNQDLSFVVVHEYSSYHLCNLQKKLPVSLFQRGFKPL